MRFKAFISTNNTGCSSQLMIKIVVKSPDFDLFRPLVMWYNDKILFKWKQEVEENVV